MKKYGIALGIVLAMAATAGNAEVDDGGNPDWKTYSAAGCGATNHAKANVAKTGAIFNTATAVNNFTCPVTVDRLSGNTKFYYMTVLRKAGAAAMTCYLSIQRQGSVTTTTTRVLTTGGDSLVSFSSTGIPDSAALGCAVPATVASGASGIKHYYVWEY
jgi:hypothetical protein